MLSRVKLFQARKIEFFKQSANQVFIPELKSSFKATV